LLFAMTHLTVVTEAYWVALAAKEHHTSITCKVDKNIYHARSRGFRYCIAAVACWNTMTHKQTHDTHSSGAVCIRHAG